MKTKIISFVIAFVIIQLLNNHLAAQGYYWGALLKEKKVDYIHDIYKCDEIRIISNVFYTKSSIPNKILRSIEKILKKNIKNNSYCKAVMWGPYSTKTEAKLEYINLLKKGSAEFNEYAYMRRFVIYGTVVRKWEAVYRLSKQEKLDMKNL